MPKTPAQKIAALRASRNGYTLNINNTIDKLKALTSNALSEDAVDEVEVLLSRLAKYQSSIEPLNSQLLHLLEEDEIEDFVATSISLTDSIVEVTTTANQVVKRFLKQVSSSASCSSPSTTTVSGSTSPGGNSQRSTFRAKLEDLRIKPFDGDAKNWQTFEDIFMSNIGNSDLSGSEKLSYLFKYLNDSSVKPILGIRIRDENFEVAWTKLKEKFGDPQVAIFAHFEELFKLPSARDNPSVKLEDIYDECEKHIRCLVALGVEEDKFGIVFTPLILSKLPRNIRTQLHRNKGSKPWDLSILRSLMKEELDALEQSDRFNAAPFKSTSHSASFQFFIFSTTSTCASSEVVRSEAVSAHAGCNAESGQIWNWFGSHLRLLL